MQNNCTFKILSQDLNLPIEESKISFGNIDQEMTEVFSSSEGEISVNSDLLDSLCTLAASGYSSRSLTLSEHLNNNIIRLIPDRPVGYLNRIDFYPADRVTLRAHITEPTNIVLCRHGIKLDPVVDLGSLPIQLQNPNDIEDVVIDGLDWEVSSEFNIPSEITGGLYSLRLISHNTEEVFQAIPIVVNTPRNLRGRNSKLLVMASNTTWQSYNIYGGRSRYRRNQGVGAVQFRKLKGPKKFIIKLAGKILPTRIKRIILNSPRFREPNSPWKFLRLAINRPFTHCGLEDDSPERPFLNHLAAGEWRLLAWLERENIDFDYCSGTCLHFDNEVVNSYSAIVFSTHCEYWSREMYNKVQEYHHNKGLWIINASGNTMYRLIDFYKDGSTICKSLSFNDAYKDETELVGGRFDAIDYGTAAAYKVLRPKHWIFEGLNVNSRSKIGEKSLNTNTPPKHSRYDPGRIGHPDGLRGEGASGWECDKRPLNRNKQFVMVAKGLNKGGGAEMTVKEEKGLTGGTFSASSITFSGALLVDNILSRSLKNVIQRALK